MFAFDEWKINNAEEFVSHVCEPKLLKGVVLCHPNILVNLIFIAMVTVAVLMRGCHRDRKVCRVCGYPSG